MTHICVGNLTIIGSDNGLLPGGRLAIIWTNDGILLIGLLGTNFREILIKIHTFSFNKMHLKISSAKWWPFCFGLNVLNLSKLLIWNFVSICHKPLSWKRNIVFSIYHKRFYLDLKNIQGRGYQGPSLAADEVVSYFPTQRDIKILDCGAGTGLVGEEVIKTAV